MSTRWHPLSQKTLRENWPYAREYKGSTNTTCSIVFMPSETIVTTWNAYSFITLHQRFILNSLSGNLTKWSNTLKQFVGNLLTNCLSVFDHFVDLVLKRLSHENHFVVSEVLEAVRWAFLYKFPVHRNLGKTLVA